MLHHHFFGGSIVFGFFIIEAHPFQGEDMEVIQGNIFNIVKLFPDDKETVLKLFRKNNNFKAICDDYQQCAKALSRWKQSSSEKAPARRKEYADLLNELELELRQFLREFS